METNNQQMYDETKQNADYYRAMYESAQAKYAVTKQTAEYNGQMYEKTQNKFAETSKHLRELAELLFELEESEQIDLSEVSMSVRKALLASEVYEASITKSITVRVVRKATVDVEITVPRWNADGSEFDTYAIEETLDNYRDSIEEEVNSNTYHNDWDTTELEIVGVNE